MDINDLEYIKWNFKYYIVFALKYRRKEICVEKKQEIGNILRLMNEKGVE